MLYVFDTDHLSLFQRGHPRVKWHMSQPSRIQIHTTDVSYEEQMRGRLAQIRAAKTETETIQAYEWLRSTVAILRDFTLLAYDARASRIYESLLQQKLRIGTQDLRIAAIGLSANAIIVTRNERHFSQVAGLLWENWTK
jgi:tRNA(fMet)-specific endonuclease VapC